MGGESGAIGQEPIVAKGAVVNFPGNMANKESVPVSVTTQARPYSPARVALGVTGESV